MIQFRPFRMSFQAKVFIPLLSLLLIVPVSVMWLVQRRTARQFEEETAEKLRTAENVFKKTLAIRAGHLKAQYRNVANDPRFKALVRKGDAATINDYLRNALQDELAGDEIILFSNEDDKLVAGFPEDPAARQQEIFKASADTRRQAAKGEASIQTVQAGRRLFSAVSVPVLVHNGQFSERLGVLTVAVPLGDSVTKDLTELTRSEIALIADDQIIASSLEDKASSNFLPAWFRSSRDAQYHELKVGDKHYLGLAGAFPDLAPSQRLGYALLFSFEKSFQAMRATQRALWLIVLAGVGASSLAVWWVIRRAAQPLIQLRDNAEAVGRGDFSRRVEISHSDEIGQLARAFNQMTGNLEASRAELERTLETLKATQGQLIQREKLSAVGEFVAGVAHELNNPLTSVIGFAELIETSGVDERQKTSLGYITRSAERCRKIVQGLLSFARQHQPERRPSNLNEILESIIELIMFDFRRSEVEIRRAFTADLGLINVDPHQLQQVFVNILTNARHAIEGCQRPGWVRITTERLPNRVRVTFEDSGPGIPREIQGRIFDPFFTTKGVGKGTGLGLSLSYGIIKEHGGTIQVGGDPGEGARFVIELPAESAPAASASAAAATSPSDAKPAPASGLTTMPRGKRVLVIDDEDWIVKLVEAVLRSEGFEVDTAGGGESGIAALGSAHYDLIICDLRMPGLGGAQLYERARRLNEKAADRFIFMTGDVVSETSREFLKDQKRCLTKPFSPRDLRSIVARFFGAVS